MNEIKNWTGNRSGLLLHDIKHDVGDFAKMEHLRSSEIESMTSSLGMSDTLHDSRRDISNMDGL